MGFFGPRRGLLRVSNPNEVVASITAGAGRNGRERGSLTAAGQRIHTREDANTLRRIAQPWQQRAFTYYDIVPEIKYAAQFYARHLSVLRLYPAYKNDDGEIEETQDPDAVAELERIQDPGGGTSGLLGAYGRLIFLTGEGYLFCTLNKDTQREQWEMLSTDELKVTEQGYLRYKAPSILAEQFKEPEDDDLWEPVDDDSAVAYRIWRRHPRYSLLADSTMQGVLDVCEELVLLTQVVRARSRNRLAGNGILLINGNVTPAPVEVVPDEDAEEDPFVRDFIQAVTAPITDEGAASAVVPLIVRVDVPKEEGGIDNVMKHIQIVDPTQLYPETGLRRECIDRLAIGLDMPAEVLTGIADVNHWSAWQVDEQTWKGHLQPVAQQFVDDMTQAFYQPQLRELGKADWDRYYIAYDAAAVINHPDRSQDASELFDRRAISKSALREAKNFTDDDAPNEEELNEAIGIALRDGSYVKFGIPGVKAGGVETEPGVVLNADDSTPLGGDSGAPNDGSDPVKGPPPEADAPSSNGKAPIKASGLSDDIFVARVLGAAELALLRARELAGSRLRNYAKKDTEAWKLLDGIPSHRVPWILGQEKSEALSGLTEAQLVSGARDFMLDAFRLWRLEEPVVEALATRIEQHAARTLWEESPRTLPPSFSHYIAGLREVAKV